MKLMAWVPLKGYLRITQSEINILTYPRLCKSGYLIPTYPWICKSKLLILSYPGLSQSTKSIPGYPRISWLAQGVVFSDGPVALASQSEPQNGRRSTHASRLPSVHWVCGANMPHAESSQNGACHAAGPARRGGQARNTQYWPGQALLRCSCWLVLAWRSQIFQFGQELRPALRGRVRAARVTQLCSLCCRCSKHFKRRRP